MTVAEQEVSLMVVDESRRSSSAHNFPDGDAYLVRLKGDINDASSAGDFMILGEVLNPDKKWMKPAAVCLAAISHRLASGDDLSISLPGLLVRSMYCNEAGQALIGMYTFLRPGDRYELAVPGQAVTSIRARTYKDPRNGDKRRRDIDLQIKTAVDGPVSVYNLEPQSDGSRLKTVETHGRWFTFSLEQHVRLNLIS